MLRPDGVIRRNPSLPHVKGQGEVRGVSED